MFVSVPKSAAETVDPQINKCEKWIFRYHKWSSCVHQLHTELDNNPINKRFQRHQRAPAENGFPALSGEDSATQWQNNVITGSQSTDGAQLPRVKGHQMTVATACCIHSSSNIHPRWNTQACPREFNTKTFAEYPTTPFIYSKTRPTVQTLM